MLIVSDLERPEHRFAVPLIGSVTIGRSSANKVVLNYEPTVSGKHCEIYADGNAFWIHDVGSRNHTYVNGKLVADRAEIISGSEVRLGAAKLRFEMR